MEKKDEMNRKSECLDIDTMDEVPIVQNESSTESRDPNPHSKTVAEESLWAEKESSARCDDCKVLEMMGTSLVISKEEEGEDSLDLESKTADGSLSGEEDQEEVDGLADDMSDSALGEGEMEQYEEEFDAENRTLEFFSEEDDSDSTHHMGDRANLHVMFTEEDVHERLVELGVGNPEAVSRCLKQGMLNGFLECNSLEDRLIIQPCFKCEKLVVVTVEDILFQPSSSKKGDTCITCPNKDCAAHYYVTAICHGQAQLDFGPNHNHCEMCPGFGQCIFSDQDTHCNRCGDHFHQQSGCECRYELFDAYVSHLMQGKSLFDHQQQ